MTETQVLDRIKTGIGEVTLTRGPRKYWRTPKPDSQISEPVIVPDALYIAISFYLSKEALLPYMVKNAEAKMEFNNDNLCPMIKELVEERFGQCGASASERILRDETGSHFAGKAVELEYSLLADEELKQSYPWIRGYSEDDAGGRRAIAHIAEEMQHIRERALQRALNSNERDIKGFEL